GYRGRGGVVFGRAVAGRRAEIVGVESMVGLFINTLPVRVRVAEESRLDEWLRDLQDDQAEARQHEWTPLSQVQRWSGVPQGTALFESLFAFENYPVDTS